MKPNKQAVCKLCLVVRVYKGAGRRAVSKMHLTYADANKRWTQRHRTSGLRYMAVFSPEDRRGVRWQLKRYSSPYSA